VNGKDGVNGRDGTPADLAPEPRHPLEPSGTGACAAGQYCAPYGKASAQDTEHHPVASYFKTPDGMVHLEGSAVIPVSATAPALGSAVLILPVGYRPPGGRDFAVFTYGPQPGVISVLDDGSVLVRAGGTRFVSLDGVEFLP
jgi:hypothetical protein